METKQKRFSRWQVASFTGIALAFGFSVLSFSLWQQSNEQVERAIGSVLVQPTPMTKLGVGTTMLNYNFPDSSILPDNWLYPWQMIRDRIETILSQGKIEYVALNLTHADNRLLATQALLQKGKLELAMESGIKAERYIRDAADGLKKLPNNEHDQAQWRAIWQTARAHEDLLQQFEAASPEIARPSFELMKAENLQIQEEVKGVLSLGENK
jgi:hypothetical protein